MSTFYELMIKRSSENGIVTPRENNESLDRYIWDEEKEKTGRQIVFF